MWQWRKSLSVLEAFEHLYLKASENVSDSGQSWGRVSLLDTEADRKTGILFFDTDEIINAVGTNLMFASAGMCTSSRKSLLEFAVSFSVCLGEQVTATEMFRCFGIFTNLDWPFIGAFTDFQDF